MVRTIISILSYIDGFFSLTISQQKLWLFFFILISSWTIIFFVGLILKWKKFSFLKNFPSVRGNYFWYLQSIYFFLFAVLLALLFLPSPFIIFPQAPLFENQTVTNDQPLIINFSRPINRKLIGSISPSIPGKWELATSPKTFFFFNQFIFYPSQSLDPGAEYIVELENISPLVFNKFKTKRDYLFVIKTPPLPEITNISPTENVKVHQPIEIKFSHPNQKNVNWSYEINPDLELDLIFSQNQIQAWLEPKQPMAQGTTYNLTLYRTPVIFDYQRDQVVRSFETQEAKKITFKTVDSPILEAISLVGQSILPNQGIVVKFKQAMNKDSLNHATTLTPDHPYQLDWQNEQEFKLIPDINWQLDTDYTLTILKNAKTTLGGFLDKEISYQFSTVGAVKIIRVFPQKDSTNVKQEEHLSLTFDQPVDEQSATSKFSITPEVLGKFNLTDNTLTFIPNQPLSLSTKYTVNLNKDVKSLFGYDSLEEVNWSFTTIPYTFVLDVPLFKQHYNFTCFSIAAKMALVYRGINNIDEIGFMNEIGYDNTPRNFVSNTWGNPNQAVVGTLDGSYPGGYGTHWNPIANTLRKYRQVEIKNNWNIPDLLEKVYQRNPVLVWWVNGVWPAKDVSWYTPNGEKIYTVNGMHVEVVKGWVGDIDNPDYILTNDPWRGNRRYTPSQFNNLWRWFSNTAIIVY